MRYVAESIPPLNVRMNNYRKGKSGYQDDHYRNFFKNRTFSIQGIEKLLTNGYEN